MLKKIIDSIKEFLTDVKTETKKITFPTREDTMGTTMVVVVLVLIAAVYMWVLDMSFSTIIAKILP